MKRRIAGPLAAIESGVFTTSTREHLLELERRKAELKNVEPAAATVRFHPKAAEI